MLKKETSIDKEKIIIWDWLVRIEDRSLVGKKPPDEINVKAKLNASKSRILIIFKAKKINNVSNEYSVIILNDCFNISLESNDKKSVTLFFKFLSKISMSKIIENKKYNPPIHWDEDLHKIKLWSKCFILLKTVNPVDVNPEIDSK